MTEAGTPPVACPMNLIGTWAHLLMDSFARCGVTDVIITPGSRSTPYVLAAVRHPAMRCTSLIDERVAGFHALGMAKATGRPTLLLCTSGSAPAHYLPALIEASQSYVPIIVLSADRPHALQDCGAPQTVDQVRLFGPFARWFVDLGDPQSEPAALRALRRKAIQAVLTAQHPLPGPVHVNARASKPLEPMPALPEELAQATEAIEILREPVARAYPPEVRIAAEDLDAVAALLAPCKRGMIVCGPAPLWRRHERDDVFRFARTTGFALLAEATSQARFARGRDGVLTLDAFDTVLRNPEAARQIEPDAIIQIGPAPTSAAFDRWLPTVRAPRVVLAPHGWQDPSSTAHSVVSAPIGTTLQSLMARIGPMTAEPSWVERVRWWDDLAWRWADELAPEQGALSEAACVRVVVETLGEGALLGLGNSLPVRLVDAWCPGGRSDVAVYAQRGANGIDGFISGFAGAMAKWPRPGVLVVGDVTAAHDVAGLWAARKASQPMVVVVINNGGGRIFEQLPVARLDGIEADFGLWTTPPEVDFGAIAEGYGVAHRRVASVDDLRLCLIEALGAPGCTVVEAMVPQSDAVVRNRRLWSLRPGGLDTENRECVGDEQKETAPVRRWREGRGSRAVVLLHGFALGPASWNRVVELLPRGTHVIRPALCGHGLDRSARTFEEEVDRIAAVLRDEGGRSALLCGYSLGARVALGLLVRHGGMFSRAVLLGVHPGLSTAEERQERASWDDGWADLLEKRGMGAFVDAWERLPIFASQSRLAAEVVEAQRRARLAMDARGLAVAMRVLGLARMPDWKGALGEVRTPVTLVAGEHDARFCNLARTMVDLMPNAELKVVPGCGHNVVLEDPAAVAALLRKESSA